ncbi:TlpA family protein disulfide reductase [bacterium]|nr:TlpA family protein disulfide reductase [bacterium]
MMNADIRRRTGRLSSRPVVWEALVTGLTLILVLIPSVHAAEDLGAAPRFTLETVGGEKLSLDDALAEGPVILDFWATWCGPCRKALPHMQELYEAHHEDGLTVLAISIDEPRNRPKINSTVRSLGLTFPVLVDGDKEVARLYRVDSVPTTFIISQAGRVTAYHRGYREGDEKLLAREIRELLDDERVTP